MDDPEPNGGKPIGLDEMIIEILRCFTSAYISPLWLRTSKSVISYITDFSFCRISGVDASGRAQQTKTSLSKHCGRAMQALHAMFRAALHSQGRKRRGLFERLSISAIIFIRASKHAQKGLHRLERTQRVFAEFLQYRGSVL